MRNLFFTLIMASAIGCYHSGNQQYAMYLGTELPNIELKALDTIRTVNPAATIHREAVIIYFSTKCPHCRSLIGKISREPQVFDSLNIYLVSNDSYANVTTMINQLHLKESPILQVAFDRNNRLSAQYRIDKVPFALRYKNKKLVSCHGGDFDLQELLIEKS